MASIPMTQKLRDSITRSADQRTEPFVRRARDSKIDASWATFVYDTLIPRETVALLRTLPKGWVRYIKSFTVTDIQKQDGMSIKDIHFGYTMDLPEDRPWPYELLPASGTVPLARSRYRGDPTSISLIADPVWGDLYDALIVYRNNVNKASEMQRKYRQQIAEICDWRSTVRLAVHDFPPLWELLGPSIQSLVDKPTDPIGKRSLNNVDYDFLVSTTAATKIW